MLHLQLGTFFLLLLNVSLIIFFLVVAVGSEIQVTLQAQRESPPDMQCKDKFLVQSTAVPPSTDSDDIPPDAVYCNFSVLYSILIASPTDTCNNYTLAQFNKDAEGKIEECKLKVVYTAPSASNGLGSLEDHLLFHSSMLRSSKHSIDSNSVRTSTFTALVRGYLILTLIF